MSREYSTKGWRDYNLGFPYPPAYDTWSEIDQRNYENGRMRAANWRLTGERVTLQQPSAKRYNDVIHATGVGPCFFYGCDDTRTVPHIRQARQHRR